MKFTARDELVQRLHRRARAEAGEVRIERGLELEVDEAEIPRERVESGNGDAHDGGAHRGHLRHGVVDDRVDRPMHRIFAEEIDEQADARALEPVLRQSVRVAFRDFPPAERRDRIGGIVPGDHVQHARRVFNGARDGARGVLRAAQRNDPGPADEPPRRPDAHETIRRGRRSDRLPRIGSGAKDAEVGGDGRACPAARATGRAREIVRIPRLTAERADRRAAPGELHQVRFGQNDRAGLSQAFDDEPVGRRVGFRQRHRSAGCRHVGRVVVVFQDNGNAVQRSPGRCGCIEPVHVRGGLDRARIHGQDGVQRGAFVVVRVDAIEVCARQLGAGDLSGIEGGVNRADRRFFEHEARRVLGRRIGEYRRGDEDRRCEERSRPMNLQSAVRNLYSHDPQGLATYPTYSTT